MKKLQSILAIISVVVLMAFPAASQTVVTDGFESGVFAGTWSATTGCSIQAGVGAQGSQRFANLPASTATRLGGRFDLVQSGGTANFTIESYLRVQASSTRQLQFQISTNSGAIASNAPALNLRYHNGSWAAYDGQSWIPIAGLNTLQAGTWHRMRFTGRNWGSSQASYDLEISSAGGTSYTSSVSQLRVYHNSNSNSLTQLARYFVFTTEFENTVGLAVDSVTASIGAPHAMPAPVLDPSAIVGVTQSGGTSANSAIDGNPATISETANVAGSFWQIELNRAAPLSQVQIVAPTGPGYENILNQVVLKIFGMDDQLLYSTVISGAVAGEVWNVTLPSNLLGRVLRLELPPGQNNGAGDQRIALGEFRILSSPLVLSGVNYALNQPSYMVRLTDGLNPPGNGNDGNLNTTVETTDKTVDAYWETDLGQQRALHHVRVVGLSGGLDQYRLSRATLSLYDENHDSVYSQRLTNTGSNVFDIVLPGPVRARYVRVGFENKIRSSPTNGIEWYLRLREVEAYGIPANEVGITSFTSTAENVSSGQAVTLAWQSSGLESLRIYPDVGSAAAATASDGSGQLVVHPLETTCYVLEGRTGTEHVVRSLTVRVNGTSLPPRISEVMASNRLTFRDGFKEASDWIEIRNPNASPLDISGYGLSDTAANLVKWTFPAGTTIPAHGYIVVCASNRNLAGVDASGYLHAGFALSAAGEAVILSSPGGAAVLDAISFPAQDEDLAYGRSLAGSWTFMEPSPGEPNLGIPYQGWLLPPVFSETRGVRTSSFSLTLTNPNPDSQLLYSLDGSEPSLVYSLPISVSNSRTVRAKVRRDAYRSPRTVTHSYLFPSQVPTGNGMNATYASGTYLSRQQQGFLDLPLVSLSVPNLPDDYVEIDGSAEFFLPGSATPVQINCGVERFGGAWTEFSKKSYKLAFSASNGARKLEAPLFNGFDQGFPVREAFDSLELRAGNHDMVDRGFYMGSRFIEDSTLAMGSLNPHGRFAHLFVNGTYWGMYDMRERMVDAFLAEYLGGAKEDYVNVRGNDNVGDTFIPGTPEPPNRELWETVRANRSSYAVIKDKVDVSHLIDFMLIWFYGNNESEYRCAGPIAPGTGFKFWLADPDGYLRTSALNLDRTANAGPGGIFGALVSEGHPDFRTLLADRIQKHFFNNGALTPASNLARLNARMNEVQNAMVSECARWGFRTPENWASAAESIRTGLFPQRTNNLLTFLRNRGLFPTLAAPVLAQHGGSVSQGYPLTFSGTTGTVYFTLDGSDPRLPGGAISPSAQSWNGSSQTLIAMRSNWKYWDRGSLPASNWFASGFNDATWSSGPAQLGYGDGDEATVVGFGPNSNNKYPATYFRHSFQVANPAQISQLSLGLVRDDGAVVYLNGVEVARSNMPTGTIGYSTLASSAIGGADESAVYTFNVPANLLVAGNNVVAVEMHQNQANSSDLSFDLSLTGTASGTAALLNNNTRVKARVLAGTSWSALTDASFQVSYPLTANGTYIIGSWPAMSAAGSSPPNMKFYQTSTAVADPGLSVEMDKEWNLPFNRGSRSRINGLEADGFSFINTSDPQAESGAGFVGSAVLSLSTTGAQDIRVMWTGGTVAPGVRDYGIRMQYRIGDSGTFVDVTQDGAPVEYLRNATAGHSQVLGPVVLPSNANNQPLLQLRWKYYFRSGIAGARSQLRVDDIQVSAGHPSPAYLSIDQTPLAGQTGRTLGPVTVRARSSNGAVATGFTGAVQISSIPPTLISGTFLRNAVDGTVIFDDLAIPDSGTFVLRAVTLGLADGDADYATRVVGMTGELVPRTIQGRPPVNDARVPWAARFSLAGLRPNATYRYANRFRVPGDTATSDGAGNMIFAYPSGFVRSAAGVAFDSANLDIGHGQFTTDGAGKFSGWFVTEPTGNERFTPGNVLTPVILLNDGEGGESGFHLLTADETVQVMDFGTAAGQGAGVFGDSGVTGRSFIVLHDDVNGSGRPLAATPVEATGAGIDSTYAGFYQTHVAGQAGRWGTILPNGLVNGVRRVETRNGVSGAIMATLSASDGIRGTRNLAGGLAPVAIHVPAPGASGFAHWQAKNFVLDDLMLGGSGLPDASATGDGVANLLKYAFAIDPFAIDRSGLPTSSLVDVGGEKRLRFQFRRLTGAHGLNYRLLVSDQIGIWTDAEASLLPGEQVMPSESPNVEIVTRELPLPSGESKRFLKLEVTKP